MAGDETQPLRVFRYLKCTITGHNFETVGEVEYADRPLVCIQCKDCGYEEVGFGA